MTLFLIGFACGCVATVGGIFALLIWLTGKSPPPRDPFGRPFGDL